MDDPTLDPLWDHVLARWPEDAAHQAFLDHCQAEDRLVEAAVRYRKAAEDPARAAEADKRLKAVAILALDKLQTAKTHAGEARRQGRAWLLLVLLLGGCLAALVVLAQR